MCYIHPTVLAELHLPSVKLAAITHLTSYGCSEQGLVPVLLRDLSGAATSLQFVDLSSHKRQLPLVNLPEIY